jgi:GT2 family glycosyltransferase
MIDIPVLLATYRRPASLEQTLRSFSALRLRDVRWGVLLVDRTS